MTLIQLTALLITLSAVFSYLNHRYLKLPSAIGIMLIALLVSLAVIMIGQFVPAVVTTATSWISDIDFDEALLHGMLSFLLFAGALHVDLNELSKQKWVILLLATLGILISTVIVGLSAWWLFNALGLQVPFLYCLLFGSLIAPTDPIAVLGILKKAGVPKTLETKITGESLFNDGVAVVLFLVLLGLIVDGGDINLLAVSLLFVEEAIGGLVFGFLIGWIAFHMLRSVNQYQVEILTTLALVTGGYSLAEFLHVSAPIAIVVAGLMIGNQGRLFAMSDNTREHLDMFWELVDEILNAVLFVMIGLEVLVIALGQQALLAGLIMIPVVLLARLIAVGLPVGLLRYFRSFSPDVIKILTWGGLRGGISIALALSLPRSPERDVLVTVTYCIVIFSILVQGLTINRLISNDKQPAEGA